MSANDVVSIGGARVALGILILLIGIVVTFVTYSHAASAGGSYFIAWGAVAYGLYRIWFAYHEGEGLFGIRRQHVDSSGPPQPVTLRDECLALAANYRKSANPAGEAECYRRLIQNDIMTKWSLGELAVIYRKMGKVEDAIICEELAGKSSTWWRDNDERIRQSLRDYLT